MGVLTEAKLAPLREEASMSGESLLDLVISRKLVRPIDVAQAKAAHFGYEFVNLGELRLTDDVIASVPRHVATPYRSIPVAKTDMSIVIALADPSDLDTIDSLQRLLNSELELRVALPEDIDAALEKY